MGRTMARCSGCGHWFVADEMVGTISRKRGGRVEKMCRACAERNMWYHTQNNKVMGTAKKNGVLCGIEFESSFSDDYARNTIFEYGFIATHDSSLESDGFGARYGRDENTCEYVSAIMQGLNRPSKFALTCEHLMNSGHLKINESCGTHFHVSINSMKDVNGSNSGRNSYMDMVRRFYHSLFIPLTEEMARDRNKTERVFGRYFTDHYDEYGCYIRGYAPKINTSTDEHSRYNFINVTANNNIEFRLNKFVNAKQYQNLMKMEVKMVQTIITNFCEHFMDSDFDRTRYENYTAYRRHKAQVTAKKLVKIYNEFAENI